MSETLINDFEDNVIEQMIAAIEAGDVFAYLELEELWTKVQDARSSNAGQA